MTKQTCWIVDGTPFLSVEAAQLHTLESLLKGTLEDAFAKTTAAMLLKEKEQIVNCLTMKPGSHPKARAAAGATRKPRATKARATPATGGAAA